MALAWLFPVTLLVATASDTLACQEYAVFFHLAYMHTYFTIPTCKKNVLHESPVEPDLASCGSCAKDGGGATASINWNIPHCTEAVCYNATRWNFEQIGPDEGLVMHPTCAWGLLDMLNDTYSSGYRHATKFSAELAVWKDFLKNPEDLARLTYTGEVHGENALAVQAAHEVDWKQHLSPDCQSFRTKAKILEKVEKGAVCWNFVLDYRDLYCNYKGKLDLTDAAACESIFKPQVGVTIVYA